MLKIKRAVSLVWKSAPGWTAAHVVVTTIQSTLPFALLYIIKSIVDNIALSLKLPDKTQIFSHILFLLIDAGIVMLLTHFSAVIAQICSETRSQRVTDYMQILLYKKAIEIDLEAYESPHYQDILERAKWEAPHRPTRMLNNLTAGGQGAVTLLAIAGLLISLHWGLICVLIVAAVPTMVVRLRQSKVMYNWHRHQTEVERKANYLGHLLLGSQPAKEIRLFNLGNMSIERFARIRGQPFREKLAILTRQASFQLLAQGCSGMVMLAAYGFIIHQTIYGRFQLGDLVLYSQAFQRGQGAVQSLLASLSGLHENNLFLADVFEFLELQPTIVTPADPKLVPRPIQQGIVFEDVSFRYQNSTRQAIERVNLSIAPGEIVALVGENGSGKTTLAKLLCRLYDPTDGRITIDGIDLKQFSVTDLHRQIGAIFQDFTRYQFTVADNIWMGNIELPIDSARIAQAARQSGADRTIEQLPQGYETLLGKWFKGGEELSGGQWQKAVPAPIYLKLKQRIINNVFYFSIASNVRSSSFTQLSAIVL
ncbi:ABC transporter ATP-binding protein [Chamaesiphon minutus]|uniref:ABC-type multidrug transport system, ATPase and permease component n=1 Tax=Chamaesiphon minutus (strain ATCC 27169 / PCC 6605) TaxID=1173020 RepID=K9UE98_CHAP6|nr:ABC transporter ATP-binding protein [Chamaesiphon minutus]AFY93437.1 ABC-type multidrug transport system, ATPase and permease component [Chamaesiphon minutus PCC 6605]